MNKTIKIIFYLILTITNLSITSISSAHTNSAIKIGENYYWHGNMNYICLPGSGADIQKYIVADLSSIVINENSSNKIEIALITHAIGRDDKAFDSNISKIIKYKNDENICFIHFDRAKINMCDSKHIHHFWKELANRTNNVINIDDLYGGHVIENNGTVFIIPKISKLDHYSNTLFIKEIQLDPSIKTRLNANRIISTYFFMWNDKISATPASEHSAFVQDLHGNWLYVDDILSYIKGIYPMQIIKVDTYSVIFPVLKFSLSYLSNNRQI